MRINNDHLLNILYSREVSQIGKDSLLHHNTQPLENISQRNRLQNMLYDPVLTGNLVEPTTLVETINVFSKGFVFDQNTILSLGLENTTTAVQTVVHFEPISTYLL